MRAAFKAAGKPMPPVKCTCTNRIPFSRGLGSSSAGIVSGLIAGLVLSGHELPVTGAEALLTLASDIEGHPDNVAPAIYGGVQLGIRSDGRWYSSHVNMPPGLQCVLFIPDATSETAAARAILPDAYSRADCVFNIGRAALIANALSSGRLDELRFAMEDRLHQPYRAATLPHLQPLIRAALEHGAHGAFLSGAGPAVLAITSGRKGDIFAQRQGERCERAVADAMKEAASAVGVPGRVFIMEPSARGAHVVCAEPSFSEGGLVHWG